MGKEEKIRSMDNPKRAEVGLVQPGTASKSSQSGKYAVEVVETVAQKKDSREPAPNRHILEKAKGTPFISLVIPLFNKECLAK
jgi:hypothetical protein